MAIYLFTLLYRYCNNIVTVIVYCICCTCHVISAKIAVGDFLFILRIKKINHDQFVVIPCVCEVYAP